MRDVVPDATTLAILRDIAETGTVGAAAARAGLSQQAASARIRAAESLLGLALVDRSTHGSSLTAEGRLVVEWSGELLSAAERLALSIRALRADAAALLTVAASQTIAESFVPEWMARFREAAGGTRACRLSSGNSAFVVDEVRSGRASVGLIETPEVPGDLGSATIRDDELVVVVAPGHPWASRSEPLTPGLLAATPLVTREAGSGTRRTVELALASLPDALSPAEPAAVLSTTGAIRAAVASGIAPAVVSEASVRDDLARGSLVRVGVEGLRLTRPFTALWRTDVPLPPAAETLFAILRA